MSDRDETTSVISSDDRSGHRKHVKYIHTINKLQGEIAMMEETLKKVKATDVTLLLQHLRENKIDIRNLQVRNTEYKERIAALELQLLEAHYRAQHKLTSESFDSSPEAYNIDALSLEEKCAKMELLIASYDSRVHKLQVCYCFENAFWSRISVGKNNAIRTITEKEYQIRKWRTQRL